MAQTVIIEQGNRQLQDVTKIKPDTRVNFNAATDMDEALKYPTTDLNNGMAQKTFVEDETTFYNPDPYVNPDAEDGGETGEAETGETETGESV